MFRFITIVILPLLAIVWQTLTETGGAGGQESGQGSGSSGGGQAGGAGASGEKPGGSAERTSTGQDTSGASGSGSPGAGTGFEGEFNPEQARALIDKLRPYETQAAQLQTQLTEAQQKLQDYEAQNQTELERATTSVANLEVDKARLQQEVRQLKVRVLGGEAGIIDTQAASVLLKWDELGEEPEEETVKAALAQMVQDRPWLTAQAQQGARQQTTEQAATNAGRSAAGGTTETQKPKPGRSRILAGIRAQAKKT
jgi:polyhydroxyalkanoate synthesis regulator phasin